MPPSPEPAGRPAGNGRLAAWLFALGLAVYAASRFVHLVDFPIFFFTDEAAQANTAEDLYRNHFRDYERVLLPPYFRNDQRWAMSLNIYLLIPPIFLFGKTVFVTRAVFAFISLLGAAAAGGALKVMKSPAWWSPPFLLAAMPVDFLHSRIAFETTPACFAGLLFAYMLYRLRSPRWIYLVIVMAGATLYSYTAGQGIVLIMGILLLLVDIRYHVRTFRRDPLLLAGAVLTTMIVANPMLREMRRHPHTTRDQLAILHSPWIQDIPLTQKLAIGGRTYASGFSPRYWFQPNDTELLRHRMKGMAFFPPAYIPFFLLGVFASLRSFGRSPGHRAILLSPLSVPFAAVFDHLQMLRVLPMVVPFTLICALGLAEVLGWIRWPILARSLAVAVASVLTLATAWMAREAITRGPTWYSDYGLFGTQYGARQVFGIIREILTKEPSTRVHLASSWANNPHPFLAFFLPVPLRVRARISDMDPWITRRQMLTDDDLFVMTPDQFFRASSTPKIVLSPPERILRYPDGKPGFIFVRFHYAQDVDRLFEEEREARRKLVEKTILVNGSPLIVRTSVTDMGGPENLFDGQTDDTVRGFEANPFIMEFEFPTSRKISKVGAMIGGMDCDLVFRVTPEGGGDPIEVLRRVEHPWRDTLQEIAVPGGPVLVGKVRIEIHDHAAGDIAHVEVREVYLK